MAHSTHIKRSLLQAGTHLPSRFQAKKTSYKLKKVSGINYPDRNLPTASRRTYPFIPLRDHDHIGNRSYEYASLFYASNISCRGCLYIFHGVSHLTILPSFHFIYAASDRRARGGSELLRAISIFLAFAGRAVNALLAITTGTFVPKKRRLNHVQNGKFRINKR